MFQPGFSLTDLAADSVDALGDATCDYCNALLFPGEALERAVCEGRAIRDAIVGRSIINDVKHESLHIQRPRVSRGLRATSELFC